VRQIVQCVCFRSLPYKATRLFVAGFDMQLNAFRITNFKSIRDTGVVELKPPGTTAIVGPNNAGKSALLDAIATGFSYLPHRASLADADSPPLESAVSLQFALTYDEMCRFTATYGSDAQTRPLSDAIVAQARRTAPGSSVSHCITCRLTYRIDSSGTPSYVTTVHAGAEESAPAVELAVEVAASLQRRLLASIHRFNSDRIEHTASSDAASARLQNDTAALADGLARYRSADPAGYSYYTAMVRKIFPSVGSIAIRERPDGGHEVVTWANGIPAARPELAVPLGHAGSGLGQVMAMLYVAMSAQHPLVIIIDEPNAFLHPGAAKTLCDLLRSFTRHQYIIATHSVEVIRAVCPNRLFNVDIEHGQTAVRPVSMQGVGELRMLLMDLGVSLGDVLGAHAVLWVQGALEEECFRMLRARLLPTQGIGVAIVAVRDVGRLIGKVSGQLVEDVYAKLTEGSAVLPKACGFCFDADGRSDTERAAVRRRSGGLIKFLPRRMIENYLLHPDAVAALLSRVPSCAPNLSSRQDIDRWVREKGARFLPHGLLVEPWSKAWLEHVHGARLLEALWGEASAGTRRFQRTRDSLAIAEWLVDNEPNALLELVEFLEDALAASESS
jgi:ABC-type uncharacterized transport system ATPase subunit